MVIKFGDRGLIINGKIDLKLMNYLGWTAYGIPVALNFFMYFVQIFKVDFPQNIVHGNLWNLEPLEGYRGQL